MVTGPAVARVITDAIVLGGSHTGLSAVLTPYCALYSVIILVSHRPKNRHSTPIHLTPTWEHQHPEALREALSEAGKERTSPNCGYHC